jgi:fatty-acyl-CoA synthase
MRLPDFDEYDDIVEALVRVSQDDPTAHSCSILQRGTWHMYDRATFLAAVQRYAAGFANRFPAGQLILFIKRLDLDLLAAYLGAIRAGLQPAQMAWPTSKVSAAEWTRKLEHVVELCRPCALFADEDRKFTVPETLPVVGRDLASGAATPVPSDRRSPLAFAQFSSGSTGLQKGVLLSHRAVLAHMKHYAHALSLTETDKLVSWLPLYHDMGLIACYLMPLMCGVPLWKMDAFDWMAKPDLLLQTIEERRATLTFLPNFAFHVLAAKGKPRELSSMRAWINCSEPARAASYERFREALALGPGGHSVCYALAENTFAASQTLGDPRERVIDGNKTLSCGPIVSGTEVRILDANDSGVGEIAIRGESLFSRFLDGTRPLDDDGFYRTGDLGLVADGELYITGRKKDLVISNGKNIYPQDVEQVSSTVQGVYPGRVVAFGIDNPAIGSEDLIVVAEPDGTVSDPTALRIAMQKAIEAEVGIVPRRIELVPHMSLVKTSSGKMSRSRNRELYLAGELGATKRTDPAD